MHNIKRIFPILIITLFFMFPIKVFASVESPVKIRDEAESYEFYTPQSNYKYYSIFTNDGKSYAVYSPKEDLTSGTLIMFTNETSAIYYLEKGIRKNSNGTRTNYQIDTMFQTYTHQAGNTEGHIKLPPYVSKNILPRFINSQIISGVLNEIISILGPLLFVLVGYLSIRKGISFVKGVMENA